MKEEQKKALDAVLAQLDKQFGKGTVMRLGDQPAQNNIPEPQGGLQRRF